MSNAGLAATGTSGDARLVVIAEHPGRRRTRGQRLLIGVDCGADGRRGPWQLDELEIERHVRRGSLRTVVGNETVDRQVDLAKHQSIAVLREHPPHARDEIVDLRPVGAEGGDERAVG